MKRRVMDTLFGLSENEEILEQLIVDLVDKHRLDEDEVETLIQVLQIGEEKSTIDLEDLFNWIPRVKEDEKLLEDLYEAFRSREIDVVDETHPDAQGKEAGNGRLRHYTKDVLKARSDEKLQTEALDIGDSIGLYMRQVGGVPLLNREEEVELAKRIERGRAASEELVQRKTSARKSSELSRLIEDGQAAREHLLLANMRLVFSVAKKYMGRGIPLLDLIQEGYIGLMRATKKFEYSRGYKFSTYATWWIRQAISRYVADQGRTIRIPVHMVERINKLLRTRHRLTQDLGRKPSSEEMAKEMGRSPSDIEDMLRYSQRSISLETPIGNDDGGEIILSDFIENDDADDPFEITAQHLLSENLNDVLASLPSREARILRLRYGLSGGHAHTLNEIGTKLVITRERVRQLEIQAKNRIRRHGYDQQLRGFLQQ